MKATKSNSASKTTKPAKVVKATTEPQEKHYSLLGVENAESIKGRALLMNAEEAATILEHVRKTYPRLTLARDVVVRLPDERKNAVILRCSQTKTEVMKRTSDLFQQPTPFLSAKAREEAKEKAKAERAAKEQSRKAPAKATPKVLARAMEEVRERAAKGATSVRVKVTGARVKVPAKKATPAPVASPAPATVAVASPVVQS